MKKTLIPIFIFLSLITCTKEYSGQREREPPIIVDTIPPPIKTYWIYYELPVEGNNDLTSLEPQLKTKYRDWYNFTSLLIVDDSLFWIYRDSLDVGDEMQPLLVGDTGYVRFEFGWRDGSKSYTNISDTLIK